MEVYLDNAATTKAAKEVVDMVSKVMLEDYGNPSSKHIKGVTAENYIKETASIIAKSLKCQEKEIVFTSGGTESNNMAIIGAAMANKRKGTHVIVSGIEHSSVKEPFLYLEDNGFRVTFLPVDSDGVISLDALKEALDDETILVSVMMVNNEIGTIEPIGEIGDIVKKYNQDIIFHVDAIQAYGKLRIIPKRLGIDLLTVSGHKIHGPKGTGFLYVADKVKMHPYIHGGGQQRGMRSGTENVPGIAGFGLAAEKMVGDLEENRKKLYELKRYFIQRVGEIEQATVNACRTEQLEDTAPHVVSVSFDGVRSEVLLHALEDKGIYVSSGSACSSNHPGISGTLKAIGVPKERLDCTLRFSFSIENDKQQLDYTIEQLKELVPVLARYTRK